MSRTPSNADIRRAWEQAEDQFPDKSTEFLLAIVCDMTGAEYGDVVDALEATSQQ